MGYALGVDLGGSVARAAIARPAPDPAEAGSPPYLTEVVDVPGDVCVTDTVERLGTPHDRDALHVPAHESLAGVVARCVAAATSGRGSRPDAVVVSHPAVWGAHRTGLLEAGLRGHDLPPWRLVPDTLALTRRLADTSPGTLVPPARVAVLDVRDEATTVGVVRAPGSPERPGTPVLAGPVRVIHDLAAADLEDAVLAHVLEVAGTWGLQDGAAVHHDDAVGLRTACRRAVGDVLAEGAAVVPHPAPGAAGIREVRVVGSDVDPRLRPRGARAVAEAATTVAAQAPTGVDAVVLTGRVATLPLLTELLAERFDAPVTVLPGGDEAAALGAAVLALAPRASGDAGPSGRPDDGPGGDHAPPRPRRRHGPRGRAARTAAVAWIGAVVLGVLAVAVADDVVAADERVGGAPRDAVVLDVTRAGTADR